MFGFLSEKIGSLYSHLRSPKLSEKELDQVLQEMETYLLEADAPFHTVEEFLKNARADLLGKKYAPHLNAQQAVAKVLHTRLTDILGGESFSLQFKHQPLKILIAGLQGTGKSTSVVKLASDLKQKKKKVLVVSFDIHRPAARHQTEVLAKKVGVDTVGFQCLSDIQAIAQEALRAARYYDVLLIDTAGRTEVDQGMMQELKQIQTLMSPHEKLYVLDAMAGQSALPVAKKFHELLECTGVIVTKLDSDARGGAILGLKADLGIPILFLSSGEHVEKHAQWTPFYPDRIAQRILGMGDLLSLIEKLEQNFNAKEQQALQEKFMAKSATTFQDFLEHLESMDSMAQQSGGLKGLLQHIPGVGAALGQISTDQLQAPLKEARVIIQSMTPKERRNPYLLEQGGRKKRIADGSGKNIAAINGLIKKLKQFDQMKSVMQSPEKMQSMLKNLPQGLRQFSGNNYPGE